MDFLDNLSLEKLLYDCGAKNVQDKGKYFLCSSPFHEDKNPSFCLYKDTGHWEDFSGNISHGSLYNLVQLCLHKSLHEYLNITDTQIMSNLWMKQNVNKYNVKTYNSKDYEVVIDGYITTSVDELKKDKEAYLYAIRKRRMSLNFIDFFQIGVSSYNTKIFIRKKDNNDDTKVIKTLFSHRLCIPIIEDKQLVSVEGRRIKDSDSPRKCIYPASYDGIGGSSYRHLFNIDNLDVNKELIVTEGIMDLPVIWEHITKNVTCTFGSMLKMQHKKDLLRFNKIIVMSDTDEGGIRMIKSFRDFFKNKEIMVARLETGDPGEASIDELKKALNNQITATEFLVKNNII